MTIPSVDPQKAMFTLVGALDVTKLPPEVIRLYVTAINAALQNAASLEREKAQIQAENQRLRNRIDELELRLADATAPPPEPKPKRTRQRKAST